MKEHETLAKNEHPSDGPTFSSAGPAALGERRRVLKPAPGRAVAYRTQAAIFGAAS